MASRRSGGSHIVFHGPRTTSVRSGGSKASNSIGPITLARRLLFPYHPPSEPLPPVLIKIAENNRDSDTWDQAAFKALNDELYDFLALVVRGFVLPWWSKITPRDKEFPQEITKIVLHLIRQIESRILVADLPSLVAGAIPALITQHYIDYRTACAKLPSAYATGLHASSSLPHLFHSLQPHMAVSADGDVDPNYIRQAVEHIMRACLPPEDWEAETERGIVREIVLKIILDSAFPRLSQPWFLQKSLLELLGPPAEVAGPIPASRHGFTFNTLVILILSAVQVISGFALAAIAGIQNCLHIISEVNAPQSLTARVSPIYNGDLSSPPLEMIAVVFTMKERGATSAIFSLLQVSCGFMSPFLNRLIPYLFYANMRPALFTKIILQSKKVLFPDGYPGPPPVEPTLEEQVLIREQLEKRLFDLVPPMAAKVLFGPDPATQQRTVKGILDPLNSSKCNVHLLVLLLDAILITLFPELGLGSDATTGEGAESNDSAGLTPDAGLSDRALTPGDDDPDRKSVV